jgi:ribose transport system permease protein
MMASTLSAEKKRPGLGQLLATQIEVRMFLLTLAVMLVLSLISPHFRTVNNLLNTMDQSVVVGMVALGQMFVILIGGIDLSVGSIAGLSGMVMGLAFPSLGLAGGIVVCLLIGAFAGLVNGVITMFGRVAPFVVTLGMMSVSRSLTYVVSGAASISNIPDGLAALSNTSIAGVPLNFILLILVYLLAWLFLTRAKGGRTLYAVGSNVEAARAAGLSIALWSVLAYVIAGVMSAVSAIFLASRVLSIDPLSGTGLEMDAIAGVVIGGSSMFGGRGSMIGTLFGVFIMVFIRNGLNLLGVNPYWQGTAIGSIIVAAVLLERIASSRTRN